MAEPTLVANAARRRRSRLGRRLRHWVSVGARVPQVADRSGLRWMLNGRILPGGAIVLLTHRGRRTGRTYVTPAEVLIEDERSGEIVVTPIRGERSDWYRNVRAGGLVDIRLRGKRSTARARVLECDDRRAALAAYRVRHPVWGRLMLWGMARQHHVKGDIVAGVAINATLVAITPT